MKCNQSVFLPVAKCSTNYPSTRHFIPRGAEMDDKEGQQRQTKASVGGGEACFEANGEATTMFSFV